MSELSSNLKREVFDFSDYKQFIRAQICDEVGRVRPGQLKLLAGALNCQTSYLSRVLNGDAHLSAEQGLSFADFFKLNKTEARFFFLLIQKARSGTRTLSEFIDDQLNEIRVASENTRVSRFLMIEQQLSIESQAEYCSSWYYAAVHIASAIPELQTISRISNYFGITREKMLHVLKFLSSEGFVKWDGSENFSAGQNKFHIDRNSPLAQKQHMNWRLQALRHMEEKNIQNYHYAAVVSLSTADIKRLENLLAEAVQNSINLVKNSEDEEVRCLVIDFFKPTK